MIELLAKYSDCDAVLFSGGIDSTLVLTAAVKRGLMPLAVHVAMRNCGVDTKYAVSVAAKLGVPLAVRLTDLEEALGALPKVVKILGLFNPMEVVNCAVVYFGLEKALELGAKRVCTGDGGDELFLGYSFFQRYSPGELDRVRRRVVSRWYFCSFDLGRSLGVEVVAPFTAQEVVELALSLSPVEVLGKKPLRDVLRGYFPEVAEREKTPLERGSCFDRLYGEMRQRAGDEVEYLKSLFKELGLSYPTSPRGCPRCGYAYFDGSYCRMCGYARGK